MLHTILFRRPWPLLVCFSLISPLPTAHAASPSAPLPNPHPVPSTSRTSIGSFSTPPLQGWSKEAGAWSHIYAVYYRRNVENSRLMAKVVYMPSPRGVKTLSLLQLKEGIEKALKADGDWVVLTYKIIQYHNAPALLLVREIRRNNEIEQIKSLIFNTAGGNYQMFMFLHNPSTAGQKAADKGWQELTGGLLTLG